MITLDELESSKAPDGFTPIIGFRRFGVPHHMSGEGHDCLVQNGRRWAPRAPAIGGKGENPASTFIESGP